MWFSEDEATTPMAKLWTDDARFERWLRVELAATRALTFPSQGVNRGNGEDEEIVPVADYEKLRDYACFSREEYDRVWGDTRHDMIAWLAAVKPSMEAHLDGQNRNPHRWLHHGLTSSDVQDTALSLTMKESVRLMIDQLIRIEIGAEVENTTSTWGQIVGHIMSALTILDHRVSVGQFSGPVGTNTTFTPSQERNACFYLGLRVCDVSNQIIPRDIHAEYVQTLARLTAFIVGLIKMDHQDINIDTCKINNNPGKRMICVRATREAGIALGYFKGWEQVALGNVSLWHERDLSHSSGERIYLPGISVNFADTVLGALKQHLKVETETGGST